MSDSWGCIEYPDSSRLIHFKSFVNDIGNQVVDSNGRSGVLIANHQMGLSVLDLFSEILSQESDLKRFVKTMDCPEVSTTLPGLIIQAYLLFSKKTDANVYQPVEESSRQVLLVFIISNFEKLVRLTQCTVIFVYIQELMSNSICPITILTLALE